MHPYPQRDLATWQVFERLCDERRAVRHFTGAPVAEADMRAILCAAQTAPSSRNSQPYQLHWVRDAEQLQRVAKACRDQRAARSAGAFVVVVADWRAIRTTYAELLRHIDAQPNLAHESKAYHRGQAREVHWFLRIMSLRLLGAARLVMSTIWPVLSLIPAGPAGLQHWATRSSLYAAQTLLLAATARGLASCPMEGFNPLQVRKALHLPRSVVIPIVIALGERASDARIEPRWRREFDAAVVIH